MFYWMDIISTGHHHIQMSICDSVRMCWSHLKSSHVRVVNTTQMTSLLQHANPRSAVLPPTSIVRPDVVAVAPQDVPAVAPQDVPAPVVVPAHVPRTP